MDMNFLVSGIRAQQPNLRLRQAEVVTLNADYTIDVKIAGDASVLPSVRYLSNFAPLVGYHVWVIVDKNDMVAIGHVARANKTLAVKAYRTSSLAITADTGTPVPMQAVDSDEWDCWTVSDPTKLTAPLTGRYIAHAQTLWSDGSTAYRYTRIKLNGTTEIAYGDTEKMSGHGSHSAISTAPFLMTKGDYVELNVKTGANLTLSITENGEDYTGWMNTISLVYLGS